MTRPTELSTLELVAIDRAALRLASASSDSPAFLSLVTGPAEDDRVTALFEEILTAGGMAVAS